MKKKTARIVIIEDDQPTREGYAYLLNITEGFEVVGSYASFEEAADETGSLAPDIILLDIQLKGLSGNKAISHLKKITPGSAILVLTAYEDETLVFEILSQGVSGYITKDTTPGRIIQAVKDALSGGSVLSSNIAKMVIQAFQKNADSPLTKRESEVLQLIADGKSRGQIAKELFLNQETIKTHIKNIYLKLNVHSRADAIRTGRQKKWIW